MQKCTIQFLKFISNIKTSKFDMPIFKKNEIFIILWAPSRRNSNSLHIQLGYEVLYITF